MNYVGNIFNAKAICYDGTLKPLKGFQGMMINIPPPFLQPEVN